MMMKRQFDKNILLCVAGMTPQIVTETLYALTREPDERIWLWQGSLAPFGIFIWPHPLT